VKRQLWIAMVTLSMPAGVMAQTTANPVVSTAQELFSRQSRFIVAAAEQMPADKYSYHPTPDQWTFGKITAHIAISGTAICGMLTEGPAPTAPKVTEADPKDAQVAALKASFAACDRALAELKDSQLGDTITYFRGERKPRARALFELTNDVEDHYSQLAGYLRLNGITPPSAQPKK
jgi:uncharacterized damage-inducible protein DinB